VQYFVSNREGLPNQNAEGLSIFLDGRGAVIFA